MLSLYFANIKIDAVYVTTDCDRDGDEILRVVVVLEGTLKGEDARRAAGAARQIRPALEENDADLFPVLSFVSKLDSMTPGMEGMQATDYLLAAKDLLKAEEGQEPRQANLRRACSTTYYAIFHTLCETCFTFLNADRIRAYDWPHWYGAPEHREVKAKCKQADMMKRFPTGVQDFATMFVAMQEKRHQAHYDDVRRFSLSEVEADIGAASAAIESFCAVPEKHRRAFAAFILQGRVHGY
jgi:hypothetical protein